MTANQLRHVGMVISQETYSRSHKTTDLFQQRPHNKSCLFTGVYMSYCLGPTRALVPPKIILPKRLHSVLRSEIRERCSRETLVCQEVISTQSPPTQTPVAGAFSRNKKEPIWVRHNPRYTTFAGNRSIGWILYYLNSTIIPHGRCCQI